MVLKGLKNWKFNNFFPTEFCEESIFEKLNFMKHTQFSSGQTTDYDHLVTSYNNMTATDILILFT